MSARALIEKNRAMLVSKIPILIDNILFTNGQYGAECIFTLRSGLNSQTIRCRFEKKRNRNFTDWHVYTRAYASNYIPASSRLVGNLVPSVAQTRPFPGSTGVFHRPPRSDGNRIASAASDRQEKADFRSYYLVFCFLDAISTLK